MMKIIKQNKAAALVEYGLLTGLVALVAILVVISFGNVTTEIFDTTANILDETYVPPDYGTEVVSSVYFSYDVTYHGISATTGGWCEDRDLVAHGSPCGAEFGNVVDAGTPFPVSATYFTSIQTNLIVSFGGDQVSYLADKALNCEGIPRQVFMDMDNPPVFITSFGGSTQMSSIVVLPGVISNGETFTCQVEDI